MKRSHLYSGRYRHEEALSQKDVTRRRRRRMGKKGKSYYSPQQ